MRKQGKIEIDGTVIEIYELRVKDVLLVFDNIKEKSPKNIFEEFLPKCTNATIPFLSDLAPSELETIWQEFQKVNASFFLRASQIKNWLGLQEAIEVIQNIAKGAFLNLLANCLSLDTGTSSSTDGDSLSEPLKVIQS